MKKQIALFCLLVMVVFVGCSAQEVSLQADKQGQTSSDKAEEDPYSYTLNEDATVLTMACWMKTSREVAIADDFNRTHTAYQIKIVDYYDGDPDHLDAQLLQMRTKLLTGETPDLFFLNSMDVMALEQAQLLLDLYPLMEADEDFCEDDYFMNIWNLFAVDGALYEFVPCFVIRGLVGPKSLVGDRVGWTYDEMTAFVEDAKKQGMTAVERISLQYMIQSSCANYLDLGSGSCDFENDSFGKWMDVSKQLAETDRAETGLLSAANLTTGVRQYLLHKAYFQDTPVYMGMPSEDGSGPFAVGVDTFAISSSTEYPEVCWEFLCGIMTEEELDAFGGLGIPMVKSIVETDLANAMLEPSSENFPVQSDDDTLLSLSQDEADAFLEMITSVTHAKLRYDGVTDLITEEMKLWFNGSQTKEQTMAYLQDRVSTYMAEHN
jgi:ABC-type glycerol-3-phosphate transport system substrate-binding protein